MRRRLLDHLKSPRAFTLTELIIVFALLGLLSLMLIPQIATFTYRSMGNTALSDCKIVMSAALTHNMNNHALFSQEDLDKRMGLTNGKDVGGGKTMEVLGAWLSPSGGDVDYRIRYFYEKGGVKLQGVIYVNSQIVDWSVEGLEEDSDGWNALKGGLKLLPTEVLTNGIVKPT